MEVRRERLEGIGANIFEIYRQTMELAKNPEWRCLPIKHLAAELQAQMNRLKSLTREEPEMKRKKRECVKQ